MTSWPFLGGTALCANAQKKKILVRSDSHVELGFGVREKNVSARVDVWGRERERERAKSGGQLHVIVLSRLKIQLLEIVFYFILLFSQGN